MSVQALLDKFYAVDNLVNVDITIPESDWNQLRNAEPRWTWRSQATKEQIDKVRRYDWYKTTSVTISGTKFPAQKTTFNNVAISKILFDRFTNTAKPSLKIDFSRSKVNFGEISQAEASKNAEAAQALFGTLSLVLNNNGDDHSFIVQTLGYEIFRQGGIPAPRCNVAKISLNKQDLGMYTNLEPQEAPFLQRNFSNNDKGNLYEIEQGFDLNRSNFANGKLYYSEGFSPFKNQKDLELAVTQIDNGFEAAKKVVDMPQVARVLAMQMIVNHSDSIPNNAFLYNDTVAVENPTTENVKLKLIPLGTDKFFITKPPEIEDRGKLSALITKNAEGRKLLKDALKECSANFAKNVKSNMKLADSLGKMVEAVVGVELAASREANIILMQMFITSFKDQMDAAPRNMDFLARKL